MEEQKEKDTQSYHNCVGLDFGLGSDMGLAEDLIFVAAVVVVVDIVAAAVVAVVDIVVDTVVVAIAVVAVVVVGTVVVKSVGIGNVDEGIVIAGLAAVDIVAAAAAMVVHMDLHVALQVVLAQSNEMLCELLQSMELQLKEMTQLGGHYTRRSFAGVWTGLVCAGQLQAIQMAHDHLHGIDAANLAGWMARSSLWWS